LGVRILDDGTTVGGTYEVERFLGEGAFAEVYRVRHKYLGRQAMKVLKVPGLSQDDVERTLCEAMVLSRLGHPNIIRLFDANLVEAAGKQYGYFTMEYVAGGTLEQFWLSHENRFVAVEDAVEITRQICRGVSVAHLEDPPIVHRDIKPQNVLVGYDGHGMRVRVSDFGLAKHVNPLTLLASAHGTLAFKAPEFLDEVDSTATDVWSIGTTLYLMLTDNFPFPALADAELVSPKLWEGKARPPSDLNINVDKTLDRIVLRCLARKPDLRYVDAAALLRDLEKWGEVQGSNSTGKKRLPSTRKPESMTPLRAADGDSTNMVSEALDLAREAGRLPEAADLLEEALNKWPELRERYEYRLRLWKRGVSM
jgi:serine/threonine protein kinase